MSASNSAIPTFQVSADSKAPDWALSQRSLIKRLNEGAREFVARYTREDGSLIWRDEWPGMDGSDDPYEAFQYLALLYAIGGDEKVYELARKMWDAITWQWSQYGQIEREFDGYYDWMHHGEANLFHYFFGLTKPESLIERVRADRFARMYTGEDPLAQNYDAELKLIKAPQSGSKGPRFTVTKEDLVTHRGVLDGYHAPFEDMKTSAFEEGTRMCNWSDPEVFDEVVLLMNQRTTRGDVPLNLNASGQMTHAFMYSGDESLRTWVLEYMAVWHARAKANGGIMPDNVGLSGKVGEYLDGKWWGGHYGWRWPHGFFTIIEPVINTCLNAYLLTGDINQVQMAREQIDINFDLGKEIDGVYQVPNKHFDSGWADYRPASPFHAIHLWARTLDPQDQERVERTRGSSDWKDVTIAEKPFSVKHYNTNTVPWYEFINGNLPTYPMDLLTANHRLIDQQLDRLRSKHGDPRNWPEVDQIMDYPDSLSMKIDGYAIHAWQEFNPVYFESLIQLMLGAPAHISHGGLQHSTVRYYDSDLKRSGVPEDVGALVHTITPEDVQVDVSNVGDKNRKLVIQAGAFLEHSFTRVEITNSNGSSLIDEKINGPWIEIELAANTTVQVKLGMTRYCNTPSYETPWSKRSTWDPIIKPRKLGE
jgi:hypothetical protein